MSSDKILQHVVIRNLTRSEISRQKLVELPLNRYGPNKCLSEKDLVWLIASSFLLSTRDGIFTSIESVEFLLWSMWHYEADKVKEANFISWPTNLILIPFQWHTAVNCIAPALRDLRAPQQTRRVWKSFVRLSTMRKKQWLIENDF